MHAAASAYLDGHLRDEIARLVRGEAGTLEAIERLCERRRAWDYQPEREILEKTLAESMLKTLAEIEPGAELAGITSRADQLLGAAALLGLEPEIWKVQNRLIGAYTRLTESGVMDAPLETAFANLAARLKVDRAMLGWRP